MKQKSGYLLISLLVLLVGVPYLTIVLSEKDLLDLRVIKDGDFVLQTLEGSLTNSDIEGNAALIVFGYLSCPDYCPATMLKIAVAFEQLPDDVLENTLALFISVDPSRDTLQNLHQYTRHFHAKIIGATATQAILDKVVQMHRGYYTKKYSLNTDDYTIDHSVDILLKAPSGKVVARLDHDISAEEISNRIRRLF